MKHRTWLMFAVLISVTAWLSNSADPDGVAAGAPTLKSTAPDTVARPAIPLAPPTPTIMGDAVFPHDEHVTDLDIECEACHHEIDAAELITPHDEYFEDFWIKCQVCHSDASAVGRGPEACSNCHRSHLGGTGDQTLSAKVVVHRLCWSCHESGTGAEASENCQQCHTRFAERSEDQA